MLARLIMAFALASRLKSEPCETVGILFADFASNRVELRQNTLAEFVTPSEEKFSMAKKDLTAESHEGEPSN